MEKKILQSEIAFCQLDELDSVDSNLVKKAIAATANSYAPYSTFHVGAALRLANGVEIIGANQENAAFPVTICAERSAIFNAQANYPDQPVTHLAIAARSEKGLVEDPISPCGMCRQAILEIEHRYKHPIRILLYGTKGVYILKSIRDILPLSFTEDDMK